MLKWSQASRPSREPENTTSQKGAPSATRRSGSTNHAEPQSVSIWLYVAGLCVTLAGLYAVNFGVEDQNFVMMTYCVSTIGYVLSYFLRIFRVSLQSIQIPLMVCLGLIFFAGISSDQGLGWFAPPSILEDRAKGLQLIFVYMALIHSFTLSTDAAVLFACVPCMTMLALVSTTTSEPQVQNAFLVFIGAATFLMVHENYLRTRSARVVGKNPSRERRLFGGQLQLTAFCVVGALILANFVAVPIRTVGQTLFLPNSISPLNNSRQGPPPGSLGNRIMVKERESIELAGGPGTESDIALLRIRADAGTYWRGATFDYYTGHSFETRTSEAERVEPAAIERDANERQRDYMNFYGDSSRNGNDDRLTYLIPESPLDLPAREMAGSHEMRQFVTVIGGVMTSLYGASRVERVTTSIKGLTVSQAGNLTPAMSLPVGSIYEVLSRVPETDPEKLRAAAAQRASLPPSISMFYLQKHPASEPDNPRLAELAAQITKGISNDYDRVVAIQDYIARTCKYNLQAPAPPRDRDVVEHFLFDAKQAYCDRFAAAMTLLCRYANIPARLASGFLTGDIERDGTYLVREKHKHVWTEVFFPNVGWVEFDATDGAEDISDRSGKGKRGGSFLAWLMSNGWLPPTLAAVVLTLLGYVLKTELWDRLRPKRSGGEPRIERAPNNISIINTYVNASQALARKGLTRGEAMTPEEYLDMVKEKTGNSAPVVAEALATLTRLHKRYRYGREVASQEDVKAAATALGQLTTALAQMKRGALNTRPLPSPAATG